MLNSSFRSGNFYKYWSGVIFIRDNEEVGPINWLGQPDHYFYYSRSHSDECFSIKTLNQHNMYILGLYTVLTLYIVSTTTTIIIIIGIPLGCKIYWFSEIKQWEERERTV